MEMKMSTIYPFCTRRQRLIELPQPHISTFRSSAKLTQTSTAIAILILCQSATLAIELNPLSIDPLMEIATQGLDLAFSIQKGVSNVLGTASSPSVGTSLDSVAPRPRLNFLDATIGQDQNEVFSSGLGLIDKVSSAFGSKQIEAVIGRRDVDRPTITVAGRTAADVIKAIGFNAEKHRILSSGYYLQMERIINPLVTDEERVKQVPVLIHHGVLEDSRSYISTGRYSKPMRPPYDNSFDKGNRCLAFYLSNNNYDVWLLNARGVNEENSYHTPDIKDKDYWNFSLDELALEDLPRQVDYVRQVTGKDKVAYIGYSMSTYMMFAKLAQEPAFADKILVYFGMAPVVFTANIRSVTRLLSQSLIVPFDILKPMTPFLTKGFSNVLDFLLPGACGQVVLRDSVCKFFINLVSGSDDTLSVIDESYFSHFPRPTSFKVLGQFGQGLQSGCFCRFDHGPQENIVRYGSPVAPPFNVSAITLKTIVLFRGIMDHLSTTPDVTRLISELRVPIYEDHILEKYNHIDYIYAEDTYEKVNRHILRILNELSSPRQPDPSERVPKEVIE